MSYLNRILKLIISIESIIISSLTQINISLPLINNFNNVYEFQVNLQIPVIILLTIIFSGELIFKAYFLYILIGLFLLPVFFDGGSLGYLLTPNFGYLLGIFPLIKVINILYKKNNFKFVEFFKYSTIAIFIMHLIGILYFSLQFILFSKSSLILYSIGKYSLSKLPCQIISLIPVIILFKILNKLKIIDR